MPKDKMRKELGDWVRDSRSDRLKDEPAREKKRWNEAVDKAANKYKWGAGVKERVKK